MDTSVLVALGIGLLLLMILGHVVMKPVRWVFKIAFHSALGFIMLWGINLAGGYFGFSLPINLFTALIAGFLGVPGIILLIIFRYMIG